MGDTETPSVKTKLLRAVRKPSRGLANVRRLIPECSEAELAEAFAKAARWGRSDVVQLLLPFCNPKATQSEALYLAAGAGHLHIVRQLLPVSDPSAGSGGALVNAALGGHADVLRELMPVTEVGAGVGLALYAAARNGHLAAVQELIPFSDPKAKSSQALCVAAQYGHLDVIRELLPVSDAAAAFRHTTESIVQLIKKRGLEEAGRAPALLALDALAPYAGEEEVERALKTMLETPVQLLETVPQLTAFHAAARLRQTLPSAETARRGRRSL